MSIEVKVYVTILIPEDEDRSDLNEEVDDAITEAIAYNGWEIVDMEIK